MTITDGGHKRPAVDFGFRVSEPTRCIQWRTLN